MFESKNDQNLSKSTCLGLTCWPCSPQKFDATPLSPEPACLGNDFQKKNLWKLGEVPWENMDLLPDGWYFQGLEDLSRGLMFCQQKRWVSRTQLQEFIRIPQENKKQTYFGKKNGSCSSVQQPSNIVETTNSRSIAVVANIICTSKFQPKEMQSDART